MKKCDVIIPVYNAPQWVKLCVYALFQNTKSETINKVLLIDDCSNELTKNLLNNLKNKYSKVEVLNNEKNIGFVKTVNKGLKLSNSEYCLLLNTDCIISKCTIEKMINHCEKDSSIGLICPISSNAANLSLDMLPGYTYSMMNELLEANFSGITFDACTIVGNCLMITKECIRTCGYLDEKYGLGYGEETDYHFRALDNGFKAKVAIDTYVFHKSEVSFGISEEKMKRLEKNRELFFSRWGEAYQKELEKYEKNDPIRFIKDKLIKNESKKNIDTLYYLPDIVQTAGGVHIVIDNVNYLAINSVNCNVICNNVTNYKEIMLFNPVKINDIDKFDTKKIISTIYTSTYIAKKISDKKKVPLLYFVQGYEAYFENGAMYGAIELSYKIVDKIITVSSYLHREIKNNFGKDSLVINNGINYDLIFKEKKTKKIKSIVIILRNNTMKGDWLLMDIIKKVNNKYPKIDLNIVYMNEYVEFPKFNPITKVNKYLGPIDRESIINIFHNSDLYVDCSLNEGFGLTPLEAMACGCIPIVSDSFGIEEYIINKKNGFIIKEVNNSNKYLEIISKIIEDPNIVKSINFNNITKVNQFDFDNKIKEFIDILKSLEVKKNSDLKLDSHEREILEFIQKTYSPVIIANTKSYKIAKFIPAPLKKIIKRVITKLYNMYRH